MTDLQGIYKKTADKFVKPLSYFNKSYAIRKKEEEEVGSDAEEEAEETGEAEATEDTQTAEAQRPAQPAAVNLLDLDLAPGAEPVVQEPPPPSPDLPLTFEMDGFEEHFEFDDEEFQERWTELPNE